MTRELQEAIDRGHSAVRLLRTLTFWAGGETIEDRTALGLYPKAYTDATASLARAFTTLAAGLERGGM
jgi:hypothetical protein